MYYLVRRKMHPGYFPDVVPYVGLEAFPMLRGVGEIPLSNASHSGDFFWVPAWSTRGPAFEAMLAIPRTTIILYL
jgi:hypothetical protein